MKPLPGFHSAERERESAPATADAAGADSPGDGSGGVQDPEAEDGDGSEVRAEPTARLTMAHVLATAAVRATRWRW